MKNLFTLTCEDCGAVLLSVQARRADGALVMGNGEIYATCVVCGHTARYVHIEDGAPVWRGSE